MCSLEEEEEEEAMEEEGEEEMGAESSVCLSGEVGLKWKSKKNVNDASERVVDREGG